jgi:hypothetical protein
MLLERTVSEVERDRGRMSPSSWRGEGERRRVGKEEGEEKNE